MDLAAGLPRAADRTGPLGNAQRYMRYQWITRLLGNPLVALHSDYDELGPGYLVDFPEPASFSN